MYTSEKRSGFRCPNNIIVDYKPMHSNYSTTASASASVLQKPSGHKKASWNNQPHTISIPHSFISFHFSRLRFIYKQLGEEQEGILTLLPTIISKCHGREPEGNPASKHDDARLFSEKHRASGERGGKTYGGFGDERSAGDGEAVMDGAQVLRHNGETTALSASSTRC